MQKKRSRAVALMLLLASLLPAVLTAAAAETAPTQYAYITKQSVYFYDVTEEYDWASREIDYLAALGVIEGLGDHLFWPERTITRADFVMMLYRAYDMRHYSSGQYFADVPPNAYYADAVLAATNLAIVKGRDGKFYPKEAITRQDAMVMVMRTLDRAGLQQFTPQDLTAYADSAQVAFYARDAVSLLTQAGVVDGGEDGMLHPRQTMTRAEMAQMIYRGLMLQKSASGTLHYVDHPERMNICVGDRIYGNVLVENYDPNQAYSGLMELTALREEADGEVVVQLGERAKMDQTVLLEKEGWLKVDRRNYRVAENCVAVQVAPYGTTTLQSTGEAYRYAKVGLNEQDEISVVYYQK